MAPGQYRILVVDDNSPDGTGALADALRAELEPSRSCTAPASTGLGQAYIAGFAEALAGGRRAVIQMDADFSHDPRVPRRPAGRGRATPTWCSARATCTAAGCANWGLVRRLISRGGGLYARTILGVHVRDLTGGFKCIRRGCSSRSTCPTVRAEGYVFQIEVTYRAIWRVPGREVPIVFSDRTAGPARCRRAIALEAMWLVPALRRSAPAALASAHASPRTAALPITARQIVAPTRTSDHAGILASMSIHSPLGATARRRRARARALGRVSAARARPRRRRRARSACSCCGC